MHSVACVSGASKPAGSCQDAGFRNQRFQEAAHILAAAVQDVAVPHVTVLSPVLKGTSACD